ncbi:MAG: nuclease-related domain-containing protein [Neisseria sp.]|nr:nuclease-related domain-containing protein [Neisseria sp.]
MAVGYVLPVLGVLLIVGFWAVRRRGRAGEDKGARGEREVKKALEAGLGRDYLCLHDLIVPARHGTTTQIDHVCLSVYGIFVVETKNFSGRICGGGGDALWTQELFGKRFVFQNPLRQNYAHIKALSELLGLPVDNFHSVVVFLDGCELQGRPPAGVCRIGQAAGRIKSFKKTLLDQGRVEEAAAVLAQKKFRATGRKRRAHVKQLQKRLQKRPKTTKPL